MTLSRPEPSEYAEFHRQYIDAVPAEGVISCLISQPASLFSLVGHLSDAEGSSSYAPGKWTVKEVVGHLSDTERVQSYRMMRIARGDKTPLAPFEQDDFVRESHANLRTIADLLSEYRSVRSSTISLVQGIHQSAWGNVGTVSNYPVSARALAYVMVGHSAHHMRLLREQYSLRS